VGAGPFLPEADGASQMRLLSEITESINLGDSVEAVFQLVYNRLREFIPYNRIAVAVADEKRERLSIVAARPGLGIEINEEYVVERAKVGHRWRNPLWRHPDGSVAEW
jgi:hypothetical protein